MDLKHIPPLREGRQDGGLEGSAPKTEKSVTVIYLQDQQVQRLQLDKMQQTLKQMKVRKRKLRTSKHFCLV